MLNRTQDRSAAKGQGVRAIASALFALALLAFASPARAQEAMTVQAEVQDGFSRIVIGFPERLTLPEYAVNDDNGVLVVAFTQQVATTLPDISGILAPDITIARLDPDSTSLRMGLGRDLRLSIREAGEELYIDLLPADWVGLPPSLPDAVIARLAQRAEEAAALAEARQRAQLVEEFDPRVSVRVGRLPTLTRIVFDWTVGTDASFTREDDLGRITFDWPVPIDLYPLLTDRPGIVVSAETEVGAADSTVSIAAQRGTVMRFYQETPSRHVLDLVPEGAAAPEGSVDIETLLARIAADPALATAPQSAADESAEPASEDTTAELSAELTPLVSTVGNTVRIVFPFETDTAAAVFRRGDVVWMIFETPRRIVEPARADLLEGVARDFDVTGTGGAQVVRMTLDTERLASLGSEGKTWVLSLGDLLLNAAEPIRLDQRGAPDGTRQVIADLARPANVHQLRDPDVGDVLEVVTVFPPARALVRDLDYVDFAAPRSVHGLVIRPRHETVSVAIEGSLAVISAVDGLQLSTDADRRVFGSASGEVSVMPLAEAQAQGVTAFTQRRGELVARTVSTDGTALDHARFSLATFYIANGFGPEALGVLDVLERDLRMTSLANEVRLARAAALVLSGDHAEAVEILSSDALGVGPEVMFWRTLARAGLGDFAAARRDALSAAAVVDIYPQWLRMRFLLASAEASVAQADGETARRMLGAINVSALDPEQMSRYELLTGRLDELGGRHGEALEAYGRVIAADIRATTSEAVMRTVSVLDRMGQLDIERAIATLSAQATVWRGDRIEADILLLLAELQFRAGQYRDGFSTVRAMSRVHDASDALDAMTEMARTQFAALYLDGIADTLAPLDALAIYYDFRHLTPSGADGDAMIRNLAQRLVAVDLLDQAAALLEYQVDNRLEGAARAQVAADLALVHIANHRPNAALGVLSRTRIAGLPQGLDRQRRVLEAQALIASHRGGLALDMLSALSGRDVDLLRVEALWQDGNHRGAAELIEALYSPDLATGTLSPMARTNIVKAAVGYVLANDGIGLARLRTKYSGAMANAPEWPMFAYVTETVSSTSEGFIAIARDIAAIDPLNGFLNAYREIYQPLDPIVPERAGAA